VNKNSTQKATALVTNTTNPCILIHLSIEPVLAATGTEDHTSKKANSKLKYLYKCIKQPQAKPFWLKDEWLSQVPHTLL